ncbi:glyoxylate/hydroxypyruvate reductase A [Roseovarius faecimaris]|uniref:Glyoxylate/hydroxypyruvate reductase A n=1 Tax=Roseovarius faecimaris TaxID=2494550 RepID=A0A6I6IQ68_9RHOB|nr:glyoxylate/hydroxypyruvate reductase A [Roseovarius faecimaris]QGX97356.1 glyoxylate/hydroxypyruvate reductase A [Roseovarius faecimaris]
MALNILFAGRPDRWDEYRPTLSRAFQEAGLDAVIRDDLPPAEVDYIVYAPNGPVQDFTPYTRAKAVLSLWAGVEKVVGNKTLTMPLTRMVDHGLAQGMREWVTGHVLRHHLGMDRDILNREARWEPVVPPLAEERKVTVLGLGALGRICAETLASLGFDVTGWSRAQKQIDGIRCLAGEDGLQEALTGAEIVVLLLPFTSETENVINAQTLDLMAKGAVIINPGRGPLIDDEALLSALDSGQISHATLDVFRVEPLPQDHPYWAHPRVTVTPHIAAETRARTSSEVIAENVRRNEAGEPMLFLVDRDAGY